MRNDQQHKYRFEKLNAKVSYLPYSQRGGRGLAVQAAEADHFCRHRLPPEPSSTRLTLNENKPNQTRTSNQDHHQNHASEKHTYLRGLRCCRCCIVVNIRHFALHKSNSSNETCKCMHHRPIRFRNQIVHQIQSLCRVAFFRAFTYFPCMNHQNN